MPLSAGQLDWFAEHGWLHLTGVFSPAETDHLAADLDWMIEVWATRSAGWTGDWRRDLMAADVEQRSELVAMHDVQLYSEAWSRAVANPVLAEAVSQLLGGPVELHHTTMHVKPPGSGMPFPMHQDVAFYPHTDDRYVDALVHLDDTCHDNGELRFLDGSHCAGSLEHIHRTASGEECSPYLPTTEYPLADSVAVPARRGDVVCFSINTVHGSYLNTTGRPRRLVRVGYRHPDNRQLAGRNANRLGPIVWGRRARVSGPAVLTPEPETGKASGEAGEPEMSDAELAAAARRVLDANWVGHATVPSAALYPHQWSWDSAFAAIGYARYDQYRAETELRSLFAGQWRNGLLPHIVFVDDAPPYFPGPDVWGTEVSPDAPRGPATSGIVQPPLHATAAWHVYRHAADRGRATRFLEDLLPGLEAWHAYLYRERARDGGALVEIWHPWESGLDNSPLWDDALARVTPERNPIRSDQRTDLRVGVASERPTASEYERYLHLVARFRHARYDGAQIRAETPFAVIDVLFNTLLVQANRDLVRIASAVGADPARYEHWADATGRAIDGALWDQVTGTYVDIDMISGERIGVPAWSRFSPLFAGVPDADRAAGLVDDLVASAVPVDGAGWVVPSLPPADARFEPARYWRGPVWVNANWLLYHGLMRYGFAAEAAAVRTALLTLARRGGFSEHYHPFTGRGHGGVTFAWSAALVLDLLYDT